MSKTAKKISLKHHEKIAYGSFSFELLEERYDPVGDPWFNLVVKSDFSEHLISSMQVNFVEPDMLERVGRFFIDAAEKIKTQKK